MVSDYGTPTQNTPNPYIPISVLVQWAGVHDRLMKIWEVVIATGQL